MSSQTDLDAAREIHIKFEFYFVALTFTMVAFAIQTGEFHGRTTDFLEGVSWVALVLSGLMGLSRLEYFPPMHRANWNRVSGSVPTEEATADLEKLEKRNRLKYKVQKISFALGVVCLTTSRIWFNIVEHY